MMPFDPESAELTALVTAMVRNVMRHDAVSEVVVLVYPRRPGTELPDNSRLVFAMAPRQPCNCGDQHACRVTRTRQHADALHDIADADERTSNVGMTRERMV